MKGYLFYDKENAEKNEWFIKELVFYAKKQNINLLLCVVENDEYKLLDKPDFVIVRFIAPKINAYYEKMGVKTFNNALTSSVACDKYKTYKFCKELNIPVLDTHPLKTHPDFYPCVIKNVSGHGGSEVFLVKTESEFSALNLDAKKTYICQPLAKTLGKDVRIYAMGEKIVKAVERSSNTDFRSNFSLGGKAKIFKPQREMKKTVKKLYEHLKFDFVGIDFIFDDKVVLNEIEDAVGSKMLYSLTKINVAKKYIKYVKKQLKKNR